MRLFYFASLVLIVNWNCLKEERPSSFQFIDTGTKDLLTCVITTHNDFITILGGYVWTHAISLTGNSPFQLNKDTIADKLLFDLQTYDEHSLTAVGADGYIYTKDSGNWILHRTAGWDILHCIRDAGHLYLAAGGKSYGNGYIYRLSKTFELDSISYFDFEISEVVIASENSIIAVGFGRVIQSSDGGKTWKTLPLRGDFFASVVFTDTETGYIIGYNGTLLKSTDGGNSWQNISSDIKGNRINSFRKIVKTGSNELIILGNSGRVWRSTDNGMSWTYYRLETDADLYGIAPWKSAYIVVGTDGFAGLIEWDR